MTTHTNTIILLNGTSSSGKTTLSNALLSLFAEPYVYMSVDNALSGTSGMLRNLYGEHLSMEDIRKIEDEEWIEQPAVSVFHHSIGALARLGRNVIVDHVLIDPNWLAECTRLLHDTRTYVVGVRCPLAELARREEARGDRPIGLAAAQFEKVHASALYDLEVDTSGNTAAQCAESVARYIRAHEPVALRKLRDRSVEPHSSET